jgi:disulfide bond formation protein DsbB
MSQSEWAVLVADETAWARTLNDEIAALLFQTAESRRYTIDQMMWQVPALSLTAQAFLLTIAYGHDSRWVARVVAACVGVATAIAGIQLLLRHRYHEELNSHWLEQLAEAKRWPTFHVPNRAEAFAYQGGEPRARQKWSLKNRLSLAHSPPIWISALALFGAANLVVIVGWIDHAFSGANPFG